VYQTPIRTAKRRPPAIGSTGFGNRCIRTIVTLAAKAPYTAHPSSEWASTRESGWRKPSLKMQW
jgi:hypothetical protein